MAQALQLAATGVSMGAAIWSASTPVGLSKVNTVRFRGQRLTTRVVADAGSSADASADSVVPEVVALPEEKVVVGVKRFSEPRWKNGTWDFAQFTKDGKVDWDAVIDAEVLRRKWLEENPESSTNEDPVVFETSDVPWWAWVRRFHLPEAEKLNGRAAMIGYIAAYLVDSATGVGLVDQQNSFFGKVLLFLTIAGVLLIRKNEDVTNLQDLSQELTFYDKQWQAAWKDQKRPSDEK